MIELGSPTEVKARHTRPELVLDAVDRAALRRELATMGLAVNGLDAGGAGPVRVPLGGRSVRSLVRQLECELTHLQVIQPSLEDTYLMLMERAT